MKNLVKISVVIASAFIVIFCYIYYISYSTDKDVTSVYENMKQNHASIDIHKERNGKIPLFNPPTEDLKKDFLKNHDEKSFATLMDSYFYENVYGEGLVYAIIAANRFNIPKGNSYVYLFLTNFGTCKELDVRTEQIVMHYIRRGISMKDKNSVQIMKGIEQNKMIAGKENCQQTQRYAADNILEIKKQVLNGNVKYYKALKDSFNNKPYPEEFLFYSIIMANRFDYVPANYDVYNGLINTFSKNHLGNLDNETYKLAMSFLEYGAKGGDKKAKQELQKINKKI